LRRSIRVQPCAGLFLYASEQFDYLAIKRGDVFRFAAGDYKIVNDNFFFLPVRTRALQLRLDSRERSQTPAFYDAGIDQEQRPVTNRGDRAPALRKLSRKLNRLGLLAKVLRVLFASGQQQGVVLAFIRVVERNIDRDSVTPMVLVPPFHFLWFSRNYVAGCTGFLKGLTRFHQFGLLKPIHHQNGYFNSG
jgi:hypothetical protein